MKDLKFYIIIATVLLGLYLLAQYNRPAAVDWSETLYDTDKIPYGTYVLRQRLNDIFPGADVQVYREPVYNVINDHDIKNASYLIIGDEVNLNEYDYAKLTKFVMAGNDVFIAASALGEEFKKKLKAEISSGADSNKRTQSVRFVNKQLDTGHFYNIEKNNADNYFSRVDTAKAIILGRNDLNEINFIKYPLGKGAIYLNANPLLFSNFNLLHNDRTSYVATALSYIKNNKTLVWDEYYTQGRDGENNTMRVFLRHPELKWAFYIAFFSLMAFVVYDMKRRQRIIPIIEPLKNSTLDFVNVVGQVYYEKRDNANIAAKKILYLLNYWREQYRLKTNKLDSEFVEALAQKTGIDIGFARDLVNHINYLGVQQRVTDSELITLNQLIEKFYKQS